MTKPRDPFLAALGQRVRSLRDARKLTLAALATQCRLSPRFLHDLEAGRGNISVVNLKRVAETLRTPIASLLADGDASVPAQDGVLFEKVALVGLRGAGKTAIGKAVAKRTKVPFVELDPLIEAAAGMRIADLFATHGEPYYRRLERDVVKKLIGKRGAMVIATGGGIVNDRETWALLRERCFTVWLEATADDHWNRVVAQGDRRPMQDNPRAMAELRALLKARRPLYSEAHRHVDTSALGLKPTVDAVASIVGDLRTDRSPRRV